MPTTQMELLERENQISLLEAALDETSAGSGRLALVSGEAGIGKTALVEAFTRRHQDRVRVLWGACDSLFTPRPLGPLHDMALQMGRSLLEKLSSNADRTTIFSAVLRDLQSQTTIMVFEDVHWADQGTLDLLRYLGKRVTQTSALLVITYRDDELSWEHPLRIALGDLPSSSVAQRIFLPPLSEQAVRVLVGKSIIDASDLYRRTGGNPFFVTEVLASPVGGIPATVRDAVLARVARLSFTGRAVLDAAAVIGPRIELWLLEEMVGSEITAVEECLAIGILTPKDDGLAFRNELARQAILDVVSPQRRLLLHRLALSTLISSAEADQRFARITHHAEAIGDRQAVLEYAPRAARQASADWAHRESAALYELAFRSGDQLPPAEHAEMLWRYARECNVLERQEEAITAIRKALDLWIEQGDSLKQGEILAFLTIMLRNHGDTQEAEQTSRAAIDLLESLPPSRELAHAYRVQATLRLASRNVDEALEWAERAVVLAERFEAGNILATAHVAIGSALLFLDYERGCAYLEQQLEFGRKTWHERYVANLLTYLGSCSVEVYHLHRAVDYLAEGIAYASERGLDRFNRAMQAWLALAYLHLGRWGEADELVSLIARGPTGSVLNRIPTLVAVGLLRARRGDPGSESALNEALELAGPTGSLSLLGPVRAARAEATWLAGDRQGAFEEAQAVYGLAVSKRHPWITGELALWCWKAGGVVEVPDWVAKPYALHVAGDWRGAADEWERLGCPFWRASALADGGREAQIAALKIFEHLGARPNADMLRGKLRAAGAAGIPRQPRSSTRLNPFGLTNRQAEILALLIEQLTNADIAARLHISPKTVDHHVSAILSGLNVRTRQEAANVARQNPRFTLQK